MPDSSSARNPLDVLAEEFVARYRAGEHPPLAEFCDRRPDLAEQIRELFPALVELEGLKPSNGERTCDHTPASEPAAGRPDRIGEFRVLREAGRGGMGVVYEAVQESLGRHVALKVLPDAALADPRQRERFRREAQAAAKLHHTNIVPVFGTGQAGRVHYYAMQFIRGQGLDAVIDELRALRGSEPGAAPPSRSAGGLLTGHFDPAATTDASGAVPAAIPPSSAAPSTAGLSEAGGALWRSVARLGAQVADALGYAHAHGVLHRDVKPSNLILDAAGTVWVTDFGLAKSADGGDDGLTGAGDVVGTLRYLAPERFDGAGDHRADVYALGLTLYELLTLRPAFGADNRARLVEQVLAASPPRPRSIDPSIPRDLETVVLKASARDPQARYPSAGELAEDLRRFADGEPVRARAVGPAERAYKWARRNPAAAGLAASVAVLAAVLAVAAAVGVLWQDAEAARGKAEAARGDAEQARDGEARALAVAERDRQRLAAVEYGLAIQAAHRELQEGNVVGARAILDGTRPEFRGWEYRYVHRLCHADLVTLNPGPTHDVPVVAWSPDGRRIATRTEDLVRVLDVDTGRVRFEVPAREGPHETVGWTPDGSGVLLTGRPPRLLNADTGAPVWPRSHDEQDANPGWLSPSHSHFRSNALAPWSPERTRVLNYGKLPSGRPALFVCDPSIRKGLLTISPKAWAKLDQAPSAVWSPCGRYILTGPMPYSEYAFRVWDARTGTEVFAVPIRRDQVFDLRFPSHSVVSPDGKRLAVSGLFEGEDAYRLRVWETATGKRVCDFPPHAPRDWRRDTVQRVVWSPDSTHLLVVSQDSAKAIGSRTGPGPDSTRRIVVPQAVFVVYDAATGTARTTVPSGGAVLADNPWSPDGTRLLAVLPDGRLRVLDAGTGAEVLTLAVWGTSRPEWSPDGRRILTSNVTYGPTGEGRASAHVWDAVHPAEGFRATLRGSGIGEWSPDGTGLLTRDGWVRIWDVRNGASRLLGPNTVGGVVRWAAWSPDGARALVSGGGPDGARVLVRADKVIGVYDTATGARLATYRGHSGFAIGMQWSADGSRVWSYSGPTPPKVEKGQTCFFSPIKVWDPKTGADLPPDGLCKFRAPAESDYPRVSLGVETWSPDRARVLVSVLRYHADYDVSPIGERQQPKSVRLILDVSTGAAVPVQAGWWWSPDGTRLASVTADKRGVAVTDARSGEVVRTFPLPGPFGGDLSGGLAWVPGRRIAVGLADGRVCVCDAETGEQVLVLAGHTRPVTRIEYSPDGSRILTCEGPLAGVAGRPYDSWSVRPQGRRPAGPTIGGARGVSFDGFSRGWVAKLWDARTGAEVFTFRTPTGVWSARWSADGSRVLIDANSEWYGFDSAPINRAFLPGDESKP